MTTICFESRIAVFSVSPLIRRGLHYLAKGVTGVGDVMEIDTLAALLIQCRQKLTNVLLLDLDLPAEELFETVQVLLDEFTDLRIIVLSPSITDIDLVQLMRLGVRSYLPRDTDEQPLTHAIEQVLTTGYHFTARISLALLRGVQTANHIIRIAAADEVHLTPREQQILRLICESCTAAEIAAQLFISRRTVEGHWQRLLEKTNATNSVGLAVFAARQGLLEGM